jgi:peptide/nickel transport system permease protein
LTDILTPKQVPTEPPDVTDAQVGLTVDSLSPAKQAYIRFLQHKAAVASVFALAVFVLFVVLTPITARYGVNEAVIKISEGKNQFLPPSTKAWFGTDSIGRDIYSRLIYGARISLVLGLAAATISVMIGAAIGAVAGLRGGLFDDILMRVTDIFLAFPIIVALLVTRNVLGAVSWLKPVVGEVGSIRFLVILFSLFGWMNVARIVRAQVLSLKEREFIEASRAIGGTNRHLILRHMLPNSIGPLLVSLSLGVVGAIVTEATLALFGYGPNPGAGSTSLGLLVADGRQAVKAGYWWMVVYPIGVLVILTLCISFIGDGLRDATDPKSSQNRT